MENAFFLALHFTKTSGKVRQSWRIPKFLKEFDSEFFLCLFWGCQFYLCNCFTAPPAAQALLSRCWGTDCSPLQQANPSGTFRILRYSFFPILLTPTHFTLLQSLHYTLQALPYTDSKRRTIIPGSFKKAISVFQSGKQFMENSFHFLCCPVYRRGISTEALQKCEFLGRIRPFNSTHP